MDLVAGQTLGRYEIMGNLGAGGMGVVRRARDSQLGRDVAVRVFTDQAAARQSRIEPFALEARAGTRLSHSKILDIHDFGVEDGITYAVAELLQGRTLADCLARGSAPMSKALAACSAVAARLTRPRRDEGRMAL